MADSSRGSSTPTTAGKKMSSALREKLRRCGRYHCSPLSGKRLCQKAPLVNSPLVHSLSRGDHPMSRERITSTTSNLCDGAEPDRTDNQIQSTNGVICDDQQLSDLSNSNIVESPGNTDTVKTPASRTCKNISQRSYGSPLCASKRTPGNVQANNSSTAESASVSSPQQVHTPSVQRRCNSRGVRLSFDSPHVTTPKVGGETTEESSLTGPDIRDRQTKRAVSTSGSLLQCRSKCQQLLSQKKETLRKLNMVKMYRTKNNLEHLEDLITKWRSVTQEAVQDLYEKMPEPKPTLTELVNHLQIDHKLIDFDPDEESFG